MANDVEVHIVMAGSACSEMVYAADHDRIVSALTDAGVKMQAERDRLAERCRELEGIMLRTYQAAGMGVNDLRVAMEDCPLDIEVSGNINELEKECKALRTNSEVLLALLREAVVELKELKESVGYRAHTIGVIKRIDEALEASR